MWSNQGGYDGGFNNDQGMGGGNFNSTGTGGGFNSPGIGASQPKAKRAQKLTPCTVAQVMNAEQNDNEFKIGDVEIHQVSIVGVVRKVEMSATNIVYIVDDMTAPPMEVRQWIESDDNADQAPVVHEENTYIKVVGNVRTFGGKRSIGPFGIMPITDMNEVTMHMAEVVQSHMLCSKLASTQNGDVGNQMSHATNFQTPVKGGMGGMGMGGGGGGGGMMPNNGLNPMQTQVHQLIMSCHDEEGISLDYLAMQLKGMSRDGIRKAVEFLSSEGHIYSTIDDDHFKSTES